MIEAPIALAELAIATVTAAADISAVLVVSSICAWRYALSPSYRSKVDDKLATRHVFYRAAVKFAGGAFVILSVPAFAFLAWVVWRWAVS
jgi:hypothetical protein